MGNDRKYFDIDTIKLIETGPSTALSETAEESTHGFVVETVGAVEDNTLNCKGFGKILGGLGFSGTCRPSRCTTKLQMFGTGQGNIALVSQWSNDKSGSVT